MSAAVTPNSGTQLRASVVVPVYYNAGSLAVLCQRLASVADQLRSYAFEFIFVDDGSGDQSFEVLRQLYLADPRIRAVRLSRNYGSNTAILAGLTYASGDWVTVIAADLQDPPELIPEMVHAWSDGADVVLAARRSRADPWVTRLTASVFNRLFRQFVFPDWPRGGCDFMLVSRRVALVLAQMAEKNSYIFGQAMWVGFERHTIFYERTEREHGRSRWTTLRKIKYFIDAFTAFSYLPIRLASLLGFVFALTGFVYAAVIIALRLTNAIQEPGFAALMVVVLIAAGVQLLVLGFIGEYLWRVLEESRGRPPFIVAHAVNISIPGQNYWSSPEGVANGRAEEAARRE